jgi:hypothetical protein
MTPGKLFGPAVVALTFGLAIVGAARADSPPNTLSGRLLISAHGGTSDNTDDHGTISLAGLIDFESAKTQLVQVTLVYQDSNDPGDGFTCILANPNDCAYSIASRGIGTLKLTVGAADNCFQTIDQTVNVPNAGNSITFTAYNITNHNARIVETQINLLDSDGDIVSDGTAVGSLVGPASRNCDSRDDFDCESSHH